MQTKVFAVLAMAVAIVQSAPVGIVEGAVTPEVEGTQLSEAQIHEVPASDAHTNEDDVDNAVRPT